MEQYKLLTFDFASGVGKSISSMLIVFLLLYLISLILSSFKYIFKNVKDAPKATTKKAAAPVSAVASQKNVISNSQGITLGQLEADQEMMVAAMTATIVASNGKKDSNIKIVSIKQL